MLKIKNVKQSYFGYQTNLSQFNIISWSFGWLTPETPKQTAWTAALLEPDFERASAITCSNVSLAAASVESKR